MQPDDTGAAQWKAWEGLTVDGVFPLMKFLGAGGESGVFETVYKDGGTHRAAIKFVPAASPRAAQLLENWQAASSLSHPSLLQIYAGGESSIGDEVYIYVVSELADDSLAGVLSERKLTAQEARETAQAITSALRYLHGKGFVHGRLQPSNVMAVGERLKIPAENASTGKDTADDSYALGALLHEMLPNPLPEPFAEIADNCLYANPSTRWTIDQVEARLRQSNGAPARTIRPAASPIPNVPASAPQGERRRDKKEINPLLWIGGGGMSLLVILVLVLWLGGDSFRMENFSSAGDGKNAADKSAAPVTAADRPATKTQPPDRGASKSDEKDTDASVRLGKSVPGSSIAKRVLPDIPRRGRDTINGRVVINVKVDVDAAGNVTNATSLSPSASKFFTKYTVDAARDWKFTPQDAPRSLVIRFLLRRTETEVSVGEGAE